MLRLCPLDRGSPLLRTRYPRRLMPEPATVWMVHARTGMQGVKGTLALQDGTLTFQPAGGRSSETLLPVGEIRRVRRAPGSPVLEVEITVKGGPPIIGFY